MADGSADLGPDPSRRRRRRLVVAAAAAAVVALLAGVGLVLLVRASTDDGDDEAARPGRTTSTRPPATTTPPTKPPPTGTTPVPTTGTTTPTPTATPNPPGGDMGARWRPTTGLTWQWQLDGGPIDTSVDADVYDVDLFTTPAETVADLHGRGRKVICYFSAGSWEPYRPDAGDYPDRVMGGPVEGWPDERWLDIRQLDLLRPVLAARFDLCAEKGFDGVEPDWMDSHTQDTGFPITAGDQLRFNRMLADMAHERGLAIGLKNDLGQVAELAEVFDFAVVEQCAEYGECGELAPFLDRGKPVFHAEYDLAVADFCTESQRLGLSSIRKRLDLDAWRETC